MEEHLLISQAKLGDLGAFNQLVLRYQDRVYHTSFSILGNEQDTEDITQETFLTAYRKLEGFRGDSFAAWLLRIAVNRCIDQLRFQRRHHSMDLEPTNGEGEANDTPDWLKDTGKSPEEMLEQHELLEMLQQVLMDLPAQFRIAVVLVDLLQLEYGEAASILAVPLGTVKSRLSKGRRRIRDLWLRAEAGRRGDIGSEKVQFRLRRNSPLACFTSFLGRSC